MFISVYNGSSSSSAGVVESRLRLRMGIGFGGLDSWVGVADGVESGDLAVGCAIWSWSLERFDNILSVVGSGFGGISFLGDECGVSRAQVSSLCDVSSEPGARIIDHVRV
jgi:hypothetical protein